jgi:transcriptional regulator with XRE-family HTH domain
MSRPIEPVYRQLAARVESIRTVLGLTQEELGKRVGLKRTSIVNFEAGRQRILLDDVEKFAKALGVTPKHLLRGIWT